MLGRFFKVLACAPSELTDCQSRQGNIDEEKLQHGGAPGLFSFKPGRERSNKFLGREDWYTPHLIQV